MMAGGEKSSDFTSFTGYNGGGAGYQPQAGNGSMFGGEFGGLENNWGNEI